MALCICLVDTLCIYRTPYTQVLYATQRPTRDYKAAIQAGFISLINLLVVQEPRW